MEHPRIMLTDTETTGTTITVIIPNVEFTCRASGRRSVYMIQVTWVVMGSRTLEFYSLRDWVKRLAKSRPWLVEELVAEIQRRLRDLMHTDVKVEAIGAEEDMTVHVVR